MLHGISPCHNGISLTQKENSNSFFSQPPELLRASKQIKIDEYLENVGLGHLSFGSDWEGFHTCFAAIVFIAKKLEAPDAHEIASECFPTSDQTKISSYNSYRS